MQARTDRLLRREDGITALETAIILIAFVVVASVFAFTILSAGTYSTEKGKEAIYAGLSQVQASMEVKGSVVAAADISNQQLTNITFTVALAAGSEPLDLSPHYATDVTTNTVTISFRDGENYVNNLQWNVDWIQRQENDTNQLLQTGELAQISLDLSSGGNNITSIGINHPFALEIKPSKGAVVLLERTTPAFLDTVMDLK